MGRGPNALPGNTALEQSYHRRLNLLLEREQKLRHLREQYKFRIDHGYARNKCIIGQIELAKRMVDKSLQSVKTMQDKLAEYRQRMKVRSQIRLRLSMNRSERFEKTMTSIDKLPYLPN